MICVSHEIKGIQVVRVLRNAVVKYNSSQWLYKSHCLSPYIMYPEQSCDMYRTWIMYTLWDKKSCTVLFLR